MRDLRELNDYRNVAWEAAIIGMGAFPPARLMLRADRAPPPLDIEERAWAGAFIIPSCIDRQDLRCIVSCYPPSGWDHVSVSKTKRVPNWYEMEQVKRLFFKDDETAFQLHVPPTDHISNHDQTLHIWRPMDVAIPMPPSIMVGIK